MNFVINFALDFGWQLFQASRITNNDASLAQLARARDL